MYKKISILIPCYNEKNTILSIIKKLEDIELSIEKEIIVIDDGSTDDSALIIENLKNKHKIIRYEFNRGKGYAIRKGLELATGDITIVQDADLELNTEDIIRFIDKINENTSIDAVFGSRIFDKNSYFFIQDHFFSAIFIFIAHMCLNKLARLLYKSKLTDILVGYKLIKTEIFKSLKLTSEKFEIETEIASKLLKKKYVIEELAVSYNPRSSKEGKKIQWKHSIKIIWYLIKYRFLN
ncbi:glycosyltransferase family 2 protein [Candidatus Dependentiae bacterium]|nr:glycosyltransferase family 2 protein [Candidatus Dependentiae bacterium]